MPREHKKPYQVEGASPAMIAAMFSIRADDLAKGIESGGIPVVMFGARHRLLVDDVKAWFRTLPKRKVVSDAHD